MATKSGPDFMKEIRQRLLQISTPTSPAEKLYGDRGGDFTTPGNRPVADNQIQNQILQEEREFMANEVRGLACSAFIVVKVRALF